jgi:methionyl aminopeptidase
MREYRRRIVVTRKNDSELEMMARAGAIAGAALQAALDALRPGVSTAEVDAVAEETIRTAGAEPSFKGFKGYPASTCIEINDVVVHGIPGTDVVVREGDVVGVDVGAYFEGFHGDTAATIGICEVSDGASRLMHTTEQSLYAGIAAARAGNRLKAIPIAVQQCVEANGFSVVRQLLGHGIGRQMHEPPQVPNYYSPGEFADYELQLRPGMVLAIEPMVNAGSPAVKVDDDGWTTRTVDGSLSAHFEHTIAITKDGPRILTVRG